MKFGFEVPKFFGGHDRDDRTDEESQGRSAEGAVSDISTAHEPSAPKNTVSMEGTVNLEKLQFDPVALQKSVEQIVVDEDIASENIVGYEKTIYVPALIEMGMIPDSYVVDEDLLKQVRSAASAVARKRFAAEEKQRKEGGDFPADYLQKGKSL